MIAGELNALSLTVLVITIVLALTYAYFWWMVVRAVRHRHVDRSRITDRDLGYALDAARAHSRTHRFLIQITTKGGAAAVVMRGVDEVLAGVARFPVLQEIVTLEIVTEDAAEAAGFQERYANSDIPITTFVLPADYSTERGTRMKARALHYMVEQHRAAPDDCYVVHFDEESVLTPENLARLVRRLMTEPVGISEGMISYGLDWTDATLINRAMESNRPFGCHECYSVMTTPPPMHVHGSNLVIRQDLENRLGWDIGTLDGSALIAEDLTFGLSAYLEFGPDVFGWHHAEMIEQPPFTIKAAFKQRERWVFGCLQSLAHARNNPRWRSLSLRDRWHIDVLIRLRVLTYALGFPVSMFALGLNLWGVLVWMNGLLVRHDAQIVLPALTAQTVFGALGLTLWLGATQLGLWYNLRYAGLSRARRVREHISVLLVSPFAGIVDTAGPMVAVLKWAVGIRSLAWRPTPKSAPASEPTASSILPLPAPLATGAIPLAPLPTEV